MRASIKPITKYGMEQHKVTLSNNDGSWAKSATFFSEEGARDWLIRELYRQAIAQHDEQEGVA